MYEISTLNRFSCAVYLTMAGSIHPKWLVFFWKQLHHPHLKVVWIAADSTNIMAIWPCLSYISIPCKLVMIMLPIRKYPCSITNRYSQQMKHWITHKLYQTGIRHLMEPQSLDYLSSLPNVLHKKVAYISTVSDCTYIWMLTFFVPLVIVIVT